LSDQALEIEGYGRIPPVTDFVPGKLPVLATTFGIFLPKQGTPPEVVETLNRIWATKIANNARLKAYALEKGAQFTPGSGQAARDKAWPEIQSDAWSFHAAGRTKMSPDELKIPKP
ncbi:MAG: tripartite tricarboxylate transporter substrate binding protein, partial [Rubrivivax sp.]|nr:tripartite tricarboxylate transporter substrate binding protein [Rubrivivax sp.]